MPGSYSGSITGPSLNSQIHNRLDTTFLGRGPGSIFPNISNPFANSTRLEAIGNKLAGIGNTFVGGYNTVSNIAQATSGITNSSFGIGPLQFTGLSALNSLLSSRSMVDLAQNPGYAYDSAIRLRDAERLSSYALDAPAAAFGFATRASLMLNTIPKLARIAGGGQNVKEVTPFGFRSLLFGIQGDSYSKLSALGKAGRVFKGYGTGFLLGSAFTGSPIGGLLMGGVLGRAISGQGFGPLGQESGGLFGLFGVNRSTAGKYLRNAFGGETLQSKIRNAKISAALDIDDVEYIKTTRETPKKTKKGRKKAYKKSTVIQSDPLEILKSENIATFNEDINILSKRKLARAGRETLFSINTFDHFNMDLDAEITLDIVGDHSIKSVFETARTGRAKLYKQLKSIESSKRTILERAAGKTAWWSPGNFIGFMGMPINTWGSIFKTFGQDSFDIQGNMAKDFLKAREYARSIDDVVAKQGKGINLRTAQGAEVLSETVDKTKSGKKTLKQHMKRTKVSGDLTTNYEGIVGKLDDGLTGGVLLRGAAVNVGRILQYQYITKGIKRLGTQVINQGISSIKDALTITRSIGRMEFGTGKTLDTQVASTERSRAISAMQNVGISARSYLGQEAALMNQGF